MRGNDGAVVADDNATDTSNAVATADDSIGDGAVDTVGAIDTVTNPDDAINVLTGNQP